MPWGQMRALLLTWSSDWNAPSSTAMRMKASNCAERRRPCAEKSDSYMVATPSTTQRGCRMLGWVTLPSTPKPKIALIRRGIPWTVSRCTTWVSSWVMRMSIQSS